jgi:hypothetical protein
MTQKNKIKTIVFRLLKWITFILVILCIVIYFLNWGIKSKYCGFHRIYKDSIECIVIYRFNANSIKRYQDSMVLSKNQTNRFINKWNNSYPIGLCKYLPKFTLTVKMKNGENRDFRINGQTIKGRNGYGFRFICGDDFFESIMNRK